MGGEERKEKTAAGSKTSAIAQAILTGKALKPFEIPLPPFCMFPLVNKAVHHSVGLR